MELSKIGVEVDDLEDLERVGKRTKLDEEKGEENDDDMSEFFPSPLNVLRHLLVAEKGREEVSMRGRRFVDWDSDYPMFPPDDVMKPAKILKGKRVDVESLFSNGGKCRTSSLLRLVRNENENGNVHYTHVSAEGTLREGKHLLICCFVVPLLNGFYEECQALIATYSDLRSEIEMVLVPKMARGWEKSRSAFDHFFSGFPDGCLALNPFDCSSSSCIDYVAKSLGLRFQSFAMVGPPIVCLVLDPKHKVLYLNAPYLFTDSGADLFPFTKDRCAELGAEIAAFVDRLDSFKAFAHKFVSKEELPHRSNPVSLAELLQCSPSDHLYQAGAEPLWGASSIPVSHLEDKSVVVYLCFDGRFMDQLNQIRQLCLDQGQVFQVVVVCLAFRDDPSLFVENVNLALKQRNISSWWLFPFHDNVCRRIWQLYNQSRCDKLLVLHPRSSELEAKAFISMVNVGISAYPFTREGFVQKKFDYFKSLNLISLLTEVDHLYCPADGSLVPVAELKHKKVLLLFDQFVPDKQGLCFSNLLKWSRQAEQHSVVVVFVPLNEEAELDHHHRGSISRSTVCDLPWLIFPSPYWINLLRSLDIGGFDMSVVKSCDTLPLTSKLFPKHLDRREHASETIFAFDSEGQILCRCAQHFFLVKNDIITIANLFEDDYLMVELCAESSWIPCFWDIELE